MYMTVYQVSKQTSEGGALYERRGLPLEQEVPYTGPAMRNKSALSIAGGGVVPTRFYFNSGHAELIYTRIDFLHAIAVHLHAVKIMVKVLLQF